VQEGAIRALKSLASLLPEARQATLYVDLTQTMPTAIESWMAASFRHHLAPSTGATRLRGVQGFFGFLCDQGSVVQSPMRHPRHHSLVPQDLPRPMAEDEVVAFVRVIDVLRDRTLVVLMLRGGLRVGEVRSLPWAAIDLAQGTVRLDNRKGQGDRGVSLAPDVAQALRQWQGHQAAAAPDVCPSRGTSLPARHIRNLMTRSLKLAGIPTADSPHALRHPGATQLLKAGAALEVVKELRGHRARALTRRSTQLDDRTKGAQDDQARVQGEKRQG
jgi:site-specific recombinase XerD